MKLFAALLVAIATASPALAADAPQSTTHNPACQDPPSSLVSSVDALIARSTRIVLARHTPLVSPASNETDEAPIKIERADEIERAVQSKREPDRVTSTMAIAKFNVVENLKGDGPAEIYMAKTPATDVIDDTFNAHGDETFWAGDTNGRVHINEQCLIAPDFQIGATYLIFTGQPHVKAYERIDDDNDAWLSYVRKAVAAEK